METTNKYNSYLKKILNNLKTINPKVVIVFGSYATNEMESDSDLDLLIVLDEDKIPSSYDEKLEMKLKVRKAIREINKEISIDLLIYTIPEYNAFLADNSSFSKELQETGKVVYEKAS